MQVKACSALGLAMRRCEDLLPAPTGLDEAVQPRAGGAHRPSVPERKSRARPWEEQWGAPNTNADNKGGLELFSFSPSNRFFFYFIFFEGGVVSLWRGLYGLALFHCPIYGNEPSALSLMLAGGGGVSDGTGLRWEDIGIMMKSVSYESLRGLVDS